MYRHFFKRFLDFTLSIIGFAVLFPVFLPVTVFLCFVNSGKPFFFQPRPGKNEKIFKVIKFKTMNNKKDIHGNLLPDDKRLTAVGKFIRKTSLDEIPQLINVIKSDMSLIGPRPLLVEYLPLYDGEQKRRHEIRPGMTGWAQVNGRQSLFFSKKFEYDVWYVDNLSFKLDIKIILMTVINVLNCKNIGEGASKWEIIDDLKFTEKINVNSLKKNINVTK